MLCPQTFTSTAKAPDGECRFCPSAFTAAVALLFFMYVFGLCFLLPFRLLRLYSASSFAISKVCGRGEDRPSFFKQNLPSIQTLSPLLRTLFAQNRLSLISCPHPHSRF